jgi:hypothetical protein
MSEFKALFESMLDVSRQHCLVLVVLESLFNTVGCTCAGAYVDPRTKARLLENEEVNTPMLLIECIGRDLKYETEGGEVAWRTSRRPGAKQRRLRHVRIDSTDSRTMDYLRIGEQLLNYILSGENHRVERILKFGRRQ